MRLKSLIFTIIIVLLTSNFALAQPGERLEFDFWQVQYQMDDILETRLDSREISGELDLEYDLAMKLSYQFWDQSQLDNNQLEKFSLDTTKDFATKKDEKLAVGFGLDYYQQTLDSPKIDLLQLEGKRLQLILDLEKKLMPQINLFTRLKYGLYNDYQLSNSNYSDINYNGNTYNIKSGFKFKVASNLNAKVGYKLSQELLDRADNQETIINDYNLSQFSQLQHGLFLGLETRF